MPTPSLPPATSTTDSPRPSTWPTRATATQVELQGPCSFVDCRTHSTRAQTALRRLSCSARVPALFSSTCFARRSLRRSRRTRDLQSFQLDQHGYDSLTASRAQPVARVLTPRLGVLGEHLARCGRRLTLWRDLDQKRTAVRVTAADEHFPRRPCAHARYAISPRRRRSSPAHRSRAVYAPPPPSRSPGTGTHGNIRLGQRRRAQGTTCSLTTPTVPRAKRLTATATAHARARGHLQAQHVASRAVRAQPLPSARSVRSRHVPWPKRAQTRDRALQCVYAARRVSVQAGRPVSHSPRRARSAAPRIPSSQRAALAHDARGHPPSVATRLGGGAARREVRGSVYVRLRTPAIDLVPLPTASDRQLYVDRTRPLRINFAP